MADLKIVGIVAATLLIAACGNSTESKPEPPPVKDTVFGDMVGTMDKAKGVEATMMQDKKHLDEAIDANDRADPNKKEE